MDILGSVGIGNKLSLESTQRHNVKLCKFYVSFAPARTLRKPFFLDLFPTTKMQISHQSVFITIQTFATSVIIVGNPSFWLPFFYDLRISQLFYYRSLQTTKVVSVA